MLRAYFLSSNIILESIGTKLINNDKIKTTADLMKLGITDDGLFNAQGMYGVEDLWIPDSYTSFWGLGDSDGKAKVKRVHIGKGIASIAMPYCPLLEELYVPGNVKKTDVNGFSFCPALKRAVFAEGFETMEINCFTWSGCELIDFPATTARLLGRDSFLCEKRPVLVVRAAIPPETTCKYQYVSAIYVPDNSVNAYKAADVWKDYAGKIRPLSEYQP